MRFWLYLLLGIVVVAAVSAFVVFWIDGTLFGRRRVSAVADWHGVLIPFPTEWRSFITKSGRLMLRREGHEQAAWISFDPPVDSQAAASMAEAVLTGSATKMQDRSFYGKDRWIQWMMQGKDLHLRGVVDTSKGPIRFRGKIGDSVPNRRDVEQDINLITGWVDAPAETIPSSTQIHRP